MALPVIIGAAAVTAVAGAYSAYQQGKISKEQYKKTKQAFEDLKAKYELPDASVQDINLEEYNLLKQFSPEVASFVEEERPELITESGSGQEKRLQKNALDKYAGLAETGKDPIADAQREQAMFEADQRSRSERANIIRNMAQRGLVGGGTELLGSVAAEDDARANARAASLQGVQDSERRRLQALGNMTNLASDVRNQNLKTESANRDIMNAFTQRVANARNSYNRYAAEQNNEAQKFNINQNQAMANANVDTRNRENTGNIARQEAAKEARRSASNDLAKMEYQGATGLANMAADNSRQNVANITQVIGTAASQGGQIYGQAQDRQDRQQDLELKRKILARGGSGNEI